MEHEKIESTKPCDEQETKYIDDENDGKDEPNPKKQRHQQLSNVLSSESLAEHAQSIIDEIDLKRKNDEALVSEFRKKMELQTEAWCGILQQSLGKLYENSNDACQEKLQRLYSVLGRISQLEQELFAFKESLKMLYSEVETE